MDEGLIIEVGTEQLTISKCPSLTRKSPNSKLCPHRSENTGKPGNIRRRDLVNAKHRNRLGIVAEKKWASLAGSEPEDRKSTRLNSSHQIISYAVFCLKKKKQRRR